MDDDEAYSLKWQSKEKMTRKCERIKTEKERL